MIEQLPAHSRYAEAVADDDELARASLHDEERAPRPPRLSSWDPVVAELRVTNERIGALIQYVAVLSKNSYDPPALPRPETAFDRARHDFAVERHARIGLQLVPPTDEEA